MKKFFTLIAATLMAVGAMAQGSYTPKASDKADTDIAVGTSLTIQFKNNTSKGSTADAGSWGFADGYTKGDQNGMELALDVKEKIGITIHFNGAVANNKGIYMTSGETGFTGTTYSGETVDNGGYATMGIAAGLKDGIIYNLEAGKYTFYVSGTKWNFKNIEYVKGTVTPPTPETPLPDPTWNFSNWDNVSGFANQVIDNLGIYACATDAETQITNFGNIAATSSTKSYKNLSFTKVFKFGGGGNASEEFPAMPAQRYLYFNVAGKSKIQVIYVNSNSSEERTLFITDGLNIIASNKVASGDTQMLEGQYNGNEPATIYIFSDKGANLYAIIADNVGTTTGISNATIAAPAQVKKQLRNGQIVIETANGTFNAVGAQVK